MKNKLSKNVEKSVEGTIIACCTIFVVDFINKQIPTTEEQNTMIANIVAVSVVGFLAGVKNFIKRISRKGS